MRLKLAAAGVGLALGVGAIGASGVLAGGADPGPGQNPAAVDVQTLQAHRVAGPSGAAPAVPSARPSKATTKPSKPSLIYLETKPLAVAAGRTGQVVKVCPGNSKAINGYYFIKGVGTGAGLVNEGTSPAGLRRWSFYLDNQSGAPLANVTFGLICIKGVL